MDPQGADREPAHLLTGENLFTWSGIRSDYIDPEMAATNGNLRLYPWQRTYMFGVDVTF